MGDLYRSEAEERWNYLRSGQISGNRCIEGTNIGSAIVVLAQAIMYAADKMSEKRPIRCRKKMNEESTG